jgi:hypothetical protein
MGTAWHSMWWSLVLAYQPAVWGSCDGRTTGMFNEDVMAEPWDGVGAMLTLAVKPQWVCYKLHETIEQPCSDFPSTHIESV